MPYHINTSEKPNAFDGEHILADTDGLISSVQLPEQLTDTNDQTEASVQVLVFLISNIDQIFGSHVRQLSKSIEEIEEIDIGSSERILDDNQTLQQSIERMRDVQLKHARLDYACLKQPGILDSYDTICNLRTETRAQRNFMLEISFRNLLLQLHASMIGIAQLVDTLATRGSLKQELLDMVQIRQKKIGELFEACGCQSPGFELLPRSRSTHECSNRMTREVKGHFSDHSQVTEEEMNTAAEKSEQKRWEKAMFAATGFLIVVLALVIGASAYAWSLPAPETSTTTYIFFAQLAGGQIIAHAIISEPLKTELNAAQWLYYLNRAAGILLTGIGISIFIAVDMRTGWFLELLGGLLLIFQLLTRSVVRHSSSETSHGDIV